MLWPPPRTAIVGGAAAADDERRLVIVVGAVPDLTRLRVAVVAGGEDLPAHGLSQLLNSCFPEYGGDGVTHFQLPFRR